jgi:hypothetical protein
MKFFKLTVLASLCFVLFTGLFSCEKDAEKDRVNVYTKSDIPMTGAQVVPVPSTSAASGKLTVYYDKRLRVLNYTISWSGLSGNPTGIGIFGPAPAGYPALTSTGTLAPAIQTIAVTGLTTSGTYTGTLYVDGFAIDQQSLLNYLYYVRITTAAFPTGELRGQVKFQ